MNYELKRKMPGSGRAMALEAGSACHEAFAAVRLWQLGHNQGLLQHAVHHGGRVYGPDKWERLVPHLLNGERDGNTGAINFALESLYASGFNDDPGDKRRTVSNLEEAIIAYVDRWNFTSNPVWVRAHDDPSADVGIEIPFDLVLTFDTSGHPESEGELRTEAYRLIGKMDGVHVHRGPRIVVHENKTAWRLNEAWSSSFLMSHQITGYCLAATVWIGEPCTDAVVHGLAIPLPKSYDLGGIAKDPVSRETFHTAQFFEWFYHTVKVIEQYRGDLPHAPKYTHSCNRYFRSCSMIPYCASDEEEKARIYSETEENTWTPLDVKHGD